MLLVEFIMDVAGQPKIAVNVNAIAYIQANGSTRTMIFWLSSVGLHHVTVDHSYDEVWTMITSAEHDRVANS